jgi:hypothetical protein
MMGSITDRAKYSCGTKILSLADEIFVTGAKTLRVFPGRQRAGKAVQ